MKKKLIFIENEKNNVMIWFVHKFVMQESHETHQGLGFKHSFWMVSSDNEMFVIFQALIKF